MRKKISDGQVRRCAKRGVSLIEGVLYLVIALAVIVGGIVFFQQAQLSRNIDATSRIAISVSSGVRSLYMNQESFTYEFLRPAVVKSGAVPSEHLALHPSGNSTVITHPFGGRIGVTGSGEYFYLNIHDLSREACVRLAHADETGFGPLGTGIKGLVIQEDLYGVTLNLDPETDIVPVPVSPEYAAETCGDSPDVAVFYTR